MYQLDLYQLNPFNHNFLQVVNNCQSIIMRPEKINQANQSTVINICGSKCQLHQPTLFFRE